MRPSTPFDIPQMATSSVTTTTSTWPSITTRRRSARIGRASPIRPATTIAEELVKLGQQGGGLTDYYASKPGQPADATFRKSAYARAFDPWKVVVITGVYMDDLDAQVHGKILTTLWSSLVLFFVALAGAFVVIRGISKPLTEVHAALKAVADEDVKTAIPHVGMRNEIGLMAKATLALQEKIRERHALADRQAAQEQEINAERQQNLRQQQDEAPGTGPRRRHHRPGASKNSPRAI